jgi:hydrogenase maturation protein HypF
MLDRRVIEVHGRVQGVGFRPHVYSLASALGLRGFARNEGAHLVIDLEGEPGAMRAFLDRLASSPPPRATIERVEVHAAAPARHRDLAIAPSVRAAGEVRVPPDVATCDACLAEMHDPSNRRFRYPFINCRDCGPRFTIVAGIPYDRPRTTMAGFVMCGACRREYEDPLDRRFHAQPIACPACGPALAARDSRSGARSQDRPLERAVEALRDGRIVAIKGLGGYHLACDAGREASVADLRARKGRDAKPLAVMVATLPLAGPAQRVLESPERPIALVERDSLPGAFLASLAPGIAPGCPAIGLMLPYTPLHHLLLGDVGGPVVMTSGNTADEPLAFDDEDAWARLRGMADLFLLHDRPIHTRCDDSVVRVTVGGVLPVRRARGFAPAPIVLAEASPEPVLAVGAHLKNTFCLLEGRQATVSQHVGDLETVAAYQGLVEGVDHYCRLLELTPRIVVHDLHPDYLSTRFAQEFPAERRLAIQHHHAHVLSCAAEHGVAEPVIGVAFDGAGLGADGAVWGGEFLLAEGHRFERMAHLAYVPLPGGDRAAREPWRMALAHLATAGGPAASEAIARLAERIPAPVFGPVGQVIVRRVGAPPTSSVGRLFDAVASLLGIRDQAAFEGQPAMELEALAGTAPGLRCRFDIDTSRVPWTIDAAPVIRAIAGGTMRGATPASLAAGFHDALAALIADVSARISAAAGVRRVALTGGVFQNARLTSAAAAALAARGLDALVHRRVPCNDGGVALGQAVCAARVLRHGAGEGDRTTCA